MLINYLTLKLKPISGQYKKTGSSFLQPNTELIYTYIFYKNVWRQIDILSKYFHK